MCEGGGSFVRLKHREETMRTVIRIAFTAMLCVLTSGAWGFNLVTGVSQEEMKNHLLYIYHQTDKIDGSPQKPDDFTWKDPAAALKDKVPLDDYVVSCMDPGFVHRVYSLVVAAEAKGVQVGLKAACRGDWRQLIASGYKAKNPCMTYHGGSCKGGIGRAVDLVGGYKREDQLAKNLEFFLWIEKNGREFGLCLPYGYKDGGHTAPCDGKEYASNYNPARTWVRYVANMEARRIALAKKKAKTELAKANGKTKVASVKKAKKTATVGKHRKPSGHKKHRLAST